MFACVIPVAPDFQDPLAAANSAPAIISSDPVFNSIQTVAQTRTFQITVVDPNVNDDLYVRWVIDYPPLATTTVSTPLKDFPPPTAGTAQFHSESPSFILDCASGFSAVTTPQRFAVFVADRPLQMNTAANGNRLDVVEPGGYVATDSWTVVFHCPPLTPAAP